ncbi:MAG: hypothetical protein GWO16_03350 [Gammaproteobacteria bacterium]|nr:hypothetical protein [Gammaproteobacteria bacterium]NIR97141.1 hypothetical protein [Gammaproteobacteria bacterium]NIT62839.1 hypothetical protein [Gammaproteobacteria bacterium]NIV19803.1 hypothetical protein [Gammaproteobacteria bacterium]NIX11336.1 hypothetical protein [Gammaproteobacteria bacterium]
MLHVVLRVAVGLALLIARPAAADPCAAALADAQAHIRFVYDGDTVLGELTGSQQTRIRLIGIDTPELGRDGASSEPLAREARAALRRMLARSERRVDLRFGRRRRDRYGRALAHVYLADGASVQTALLERGLAVLLVRPPNIGHLACYRRAEARARGARRGLWALPRFRPVDAARLPAAEPGFRVVRGRVREIGNSLRSVWLELEGGLSLRIDRQDLEYFDLPWLARLKGRSITARGWLYRYRGRPRMRIHHPAVLELGR